MENLHIVYVLTDDNSHIIAVNSSAFMTDETGWTEIDRGQGSRCYHAQGYYFPKPIITDGGAYRYKLVNGEPMECTSAEILNQENRGAIPPQKSTLEARITALEQENTRLKELLDSLQIHI